MSSFQPKFGHAADEFQRYRPDYPQTLYDRILAAIPEDRRERAMDLGAGTGIVSAHLAAQFREVMAVEPDERMAAKIAEGLTQVIVRRVTGEECEQEPESVDLVTIANALHWMDAHRVLANARTWLRPGGILAVFDRPLPRANAVVDKIVLSELRGPWKPHRDPHLRRDLHWRDDVRAAPGFRLVEETQFPNFVAMTSLEYVGFWRSSSYGSAYARSLADPGKYWQNLASRFQRAWPEEKIPVDFSAWLVLATRI
jgi:SAM-dependent methyltransferase